MRSRNIKPGFFHNPELAMLPPETRLLFIGLPVISDRKGRLLDRSIKIKMQLFPADDYPIDHMLDSLEDNGLILRYQSGQDKYIQIVNFEKHQHPHINEAPSTIPAPCKDSTSTGAIGLIPLTFNPISDGFRSSTDARFEEWWNVYDKKKKKKRAKEIWKRRKLDGMADLIIADSKDRKAQDTGWKAGYQPDATTYLNGDRWEDIVETKVRVQSNGKKEPWERLPFEDDHLWDFAKKHNYQNPGSMNYNQYRNALKAEITKRKDAGSHLET
jgi:hypothetical protein